MDCFYKNETESADSRWLPGQIWGGKDKPLKLFRERLFYSFLLQNEFVRNCLTII